jgi:transposase
MREMPVMAVSRIVKETDARLWRILKAHFAAAHPQTDWSNAICVGCDEMSVSKGYRYITVFCDMIGRKVLFAAKGKDKSVWEAFARSLEEHHGHPRQIQEVSMDMSPAYIAGVNENIGSQAEVVFDKFHVLATASKAVDETRRAEARQSASTQNVLKESRWVWLKNPENLTDKQKIKFRSLEKENLATA